MAAPSLQVTREAASELALGDRYQAPLAVSRPSSPAL
jgi:hypothetical protein